MGSFTSVVEIETREQEQITILQETKEKFSTMIGKLLTDRNLLGNNNASTLGALKLAKVSPELSGNIQEIKTKRPELAPLYEALEKIIDPSVLDSNINRLHDGVFDRQKINNYLFIIKKAIDEHIDEVEKIVKNIAQSEKVDYDETMSYAQKVDKKTIYRRERDVSLNLIGQYDMSVVSLIATISAGLHIEHPEVYTETGLKSLIETLSKHYKDSNVSS